MKIKEILGKNNINLKNLKVIGQGGFSTVYEIPDNKDLVLKWSYISYDGFRMISDMSLKKRQSFLFQEIKEKIRYGDSFFYILEKLFPIEWTEKEKKELKMINDNIIFDLEQSSDRVKTIFKCNIALEKAISKKYSYSKDIYPENIMKNKKGEIFIIDPISECYDLNQV